MRRWLMILLTAAFVIGAAVPEVEARGHRTYRRSGRRRHRLRSHRTGIRHTLNSDTERLKSSSRSGKPFMETTQALRNLFK